MLEKSSKDPDEVPVDQVSEDNIEDHVEINGPNE